MPITVVAVASRNSELPEDQKGSAQYGIMNHSKHTILAARYI